MRGWSLWTSWRRKKRIERRACWRRGMSSATTIPCSPVPVTIAASTRCHGTADPGILPPRQGRNRPNTEPARRRERAFRSTPVTSHVAAPDPPVSRPQGPIGRTAKRENPLGISPSGFRSKQRNPENGAPFGRTIHLFLFAPPPESADCTVSEEPVKSRRTRRYASERRYLTEPSLTASPTVEGGGAKRKNGRQGMTMPISCRKVNENRDTPGRKFPLFSLKNSRFELTSRQICYTI